MSDEENGYYSDDEEEFHNNNLSWKGEEEGTLLKLSFSVCHRLVSPLFVEHIRVCSAVVLVRNRYYCT